MSRSLNRVLLIGNAGGEPRVETARTGKRVATFSLATSRGAAADAATDWHRVVAWDPLATRVGREVGKGTRLFVEGRVEYRSWTDRGGRTRTATEIVAEDVIVFASRARGAVESP